MNGNAGGSLGGPWTQDGMTQDQLRAAAVHGQFTNEEMPARKPMRLDALPPPSGKTRKKKKGYNMMEQY